MEGPGTGSRPEKPETQTLKNNPNIRNQAMKSLKSVLRLVLSACVAGSALAGEKKEALPLKQLPEGYAQEVRYAPAPIAAKMAIVTKMVITRDASGKIVSVKRG